MGTNEIRAANRRALPWFILVMVAAAILGGVGGFLCAKYGVDALSGGLQAGAAFFGSRIAPWLLLALAAALPAVVVPRCKKARSQLRAWDGESEEIPEAVDRSVSGSIWLSGAALVLAFFLIAASYSGGFAMFEDTRATLRVFLSIGAFFAVLIEVLLIQQKCVDAAKQMSPEKQGSVYDMRFQKKWLDSCDEAERLVIGKCAFSAYRATNAVCAALAGVLAIGALLFETGFLPALTVCAIWLVNLTAYCREARRYSRAGTRVS